MRRMGTKKSQLLAQQWASYLREVVPSDAEETQRRETRRAFYAGAQAAFSVLLHIAQADLNEADEGKVMEGFAAELSTFSNDVKAGRA